MIRIRKSDERGRGDHGWLKSKFSFSFANYYDPEHMNFRDLRVINEDLVAPDSGFPMHPHRDMEIITYIVSGELEHRDSMGNGEVIRRGEVQRMSAGTGITHSEFNPTSDRTTHLLQIWITPDRAGHTPSYEQTLFPDDDKRDRLRLVASPDGAEGSVTIHQDARLYASLLSADRELTHAFAPGRHAWIQLIKGALDVNGTRLDAGDAAAVSGESSLTLRAGEDAEFLLFDLR
ncbi:MAG: pirin family protein [Deltaproteobacteria bacterium]|nr:pirin family protein [Deltaproteobacteria bacterium]